MEIVGFTVANIRLSCSATYRQVNSICDSKTDDLRRQYLEYNTFILIMFLKDIFPKCHELRGNIQSCKPEEKTTSQMVDNLMFTSYEGSNCLLLVSALVRQFGNFLDICRINTIYVHAPTCKMFWTLCETDQKTSLEARCFSCFYDLYR